MSRLPIPGPSQTDPQQPDIDEPDASVRTRESASHERHSHRLVQAYQQKLTRNERRDDTVTSSDSSPKSRRKSPESTDASALPPRTKPKRDKERKKKHRHAKTVSHQPDVDAGIYQITGGHFVDHDGTGGHFVDRHGTGGHFVDRDETGGHFVDRGGDVGDMRQRKPRSESTTKLISSEEENDMKSVSRQQSSVLNTTSRSYKVRIDSRDGSRAQKSFVEPVSGHINVVLLSVTMMIKIIVTCGYQPEITP